MLSKSVVLGWLWVGIVTTAIVLALLFSTAEPIGSCQPGGAHGPVAADSECPRVPPKRAKAPDGDATALPEIIR
ncbi:hypothetical protein [Cupriavidus sp. TMH.W2]|uniref:hypothetical protein n=1 Tax=Cupriavidus sp. TMH.W2 TaxID=3434465 RepID=UPI003D788094